MARKRRVSSTARRLRRLRPPGRRPLSAAAVVLGVVSAVAVVFLPVDVRFGDDPILRLRTFDTTAGGPATEVECGTALDGLRGASDAVTVYGIARDRACRDASAKRVLTAVAAGFIVVLLGCQGLAASGRAREAVT
ncbi:MAG: hypothetical protein M3O23_00685 [Actinomycetota bacterium]|nr:hypothetical protein [Actinomycetota bacterium]